MDMSRAAGLNPIRYVVTGLPRSGTKYISRVLSILGLDCCHESFNTRQASIAREREGVWGDASWMAVPYIAALPPGTVVLHQMRNPLKVLNSNLPTGGDSYFRTWDEHAGLASDEYYKKPLPYKRFIWENTKGWVWPQGGGEVAEGPEEIQRLIHWWMNWNMLIESATLLRHDLQYIRYRVEDLTPENWTLLRDLAMVLDPSSVRTREEIQKVLGNVPTTTNRHRTPNDRITLEMLPATAQLTMHRYGYDLIEEPAV